MHRARAPLSCNQRTGTARGRTRAMAEAAGSGEPADERASPPAPRRSRRRLLRVALPLAIVLAAVAVWLVASGRLGSRNQNPDLLTLYGNVDIRQVELGFRVAGRIVEM